jgi:MFS superfamily sulfate permease-like transporter
LFGTSKDISTGSTTVLSTVIGQVIAQTNDGTSQVNPVVWATAVAFVAGIIQLISGLFGLSILIDFIPA